MRKQAADPEPIARPREATRLPAGVASVLSVLSSSAVVLDRDDRVLMATAAAREFGHVHGDELVVGELLALARQVRRDGETREGE
ncbi:MAG TPA: two-component sensor histidine kinase, partial [Streptosporangiaceae bacterium]